MRILLAPSHARGKNDSLFDQRQYHDLLNGHFRDFLEESGHPASLAFIDIDSEQNLHVCAHGNTDARIAWTRNEALEGSWRVAAFHSNQIAELDEFDPNHLRKADGIFVSGEAFQAPLAIRTADCLAVAVTLESSSKVLAASCFHAGWRGYCSGIQLAAFKSFNAKWPSHLKSAHENPQFFVTIGPAVFGASYPCGSDVLEALTYHHNMRLAGLPGWSDRHEKAFWSAAGRHLVTTHGKVFPDLQQLMCIELDALGINLSNVTVYRENTFTSEFWPSHRRSVSNGQASAERLITHLCPPACPSVTNRDSTP